LRIEKPELLLLKPIYAPATVELEREFTVRKLEPRHVKYAKNAAGNCSLICGRIFPGSR